MADHTTPLPGRHGRPAAQGRHAADPGCTHTRRAWRGCSAPRGSCGSWCAPPRCSLGSRPWSGWCTRPAGRVCTPRSNRLGRTQQGGELLAGQPQQSRRKSCGGPGGSAVSPAQAKGDRRLTSMLALAWKVVSTLGATPGSRHCSTTVPLAQSSLYASQPVICVQRG